MERCTVTLGRKIARLRKQRDWTQDQFAERVGVHGRHISRWETDKSKPTIDKIRKIADVFGTSAEDLIKESGEEFVVCEQDRALTKHMKLIEDLSEDDKEIVIRLIKALSTKRRMEKVLRPGE